MRVVTVLVFCRPEDAMGIANDGVTVSSIISLLNVPSQTHEISRKAFQALSIISGFPDAAEIVSQSSAMSLAVKWLDDNMYELKPEVSCCWWRAALAIAVAVHR